MLLVFLFLFFLFVIVALFVSRKFSPIPYFPSNKKDINGIVKSLQLTNNQTVYDLGAGDGVVIFSAALVAFSKKLNTKFIAVEINPVLLAFMHLKLLIHPNRKNIRIKYGDIFTLRYTLHDSRYTIFTYISPWYLEKVIANIKYQISSFRLVSYFYPVPNQKVSRTIKGVHDTYVYNI